MIQDKLAAQLFTVRNELKQDYIGTLKLLSEMGWKAVQIDGLHGNDPVEIAAAVKELGLKTAGMHVGLERMRNDLDNVLREADLFETPDIICHSLPDEHKNAAGYEFVRRELRNVSSLVSPRGYRAGFHNHDWEFHTMIGEQYALQYLLDYDPHAPVYAEIDTYWVQKAGRDPLSVISQYSGRMPILHLKDMTSDGQEYFAEIGSGMIDFVPVLQWGEQNGVQFYAVEQDYCPGSPLDSLEQSLRYLEQLIMPLR
ncbi:sugar phosphate isomerase/epimerase family protein [Paenibacillus sp. WLX2291]|uniref:sugar phosphate isomerase/epimerase family protein n=1 Tax=Paenibacillus sp. WLX2291 TaxID=3296934 RepID=UPI0039840A0E